MQKKMQAEMKEKDAELDKLVATMNSAEESKKADAIAAVVNKMVEQRKGMHGNMMRMVTKMMQCCKESGSDRKLSYDERDDEGNTRSASGGKPIGLLDLQRSHSVSLCMAKDGSII